MHKVQKVNLWVQELSNILQNKEIFQVEDYLESLPNKEQISNKEILALFTHYDAVGSSAIEAAITRSTQHLKIMLDNTLVSRLNDQELFDILNHKDSSGNTPLCFSIRKGYEYIDTFLNSKAFIKLDADYVFQVLNEKCEANHSSLWLVAKKGKDEILAFLENSVLIKKLSSIQKKEILNSSNLLKSVNSEENLNAILQSNFINSLSEDIKLEILTNPEAPNGDTIVRTLIKKKAVELLKIFLNSYVLTTLSSDAQYKIISTTWAGAPHILKFLIKQDIKIVNILFNSAAFKNLNAEQQKNFVFFTDGMFFWEFLTSQSQYVDKLLNNDNLSQDLLHHLANNFLKTAEFSGRYTIENNRKKEAFQNTIIKVARDYTPYKEVLSEDGYSLLYYLSTKGFNYTTLQNFKVEGFRFVYPDSKNVSIHDVYNLYESLGQNETIIYLRGPDGTKPINIPGMVSSFHKHGFNILTIDSRDNNDINTDALKRVISDYSRNHLIKFFIINAHGAGNKYSGMPEIYYGEKPHTGIECSDAEIWLFKSPDKFAQIRAGLPEGTGHYILAKTLITKVIAESINKDLKIPINLFLTSCNGQLIEKWVFDELPYNSTLVTIGEHNCKSMVIHGRVGDLVSITNFINQNEFSFYNLSIENILNHYLLNINQGLAAPTYIKSGVATIHLSNLTITYDWIQNLSKDKAELLAEKLCFTNKACKSTVSLVLQEIHENNITLHNITALKAKGDAYNFANKLGVIEAASFYYIYYCTDIFGGHGGLNYADSNNTLCEVSGDIEQGNYPWYKNAYIYVAGGILTAIGYGIYKCIYYQEHEHID